MKEKNNKSKKENTSNNKSQERIEDFSPFLNKLSKKYSIICVVCKKDKKVSFQPIDDVPAICDDCHRDLEAKRLIHQEKKSFKTLIKVNCLNCKKDFYASDDSHVFCDKCYDVFSQKIIYAQRGLVKFTCEECSAETYLFKKILDIREKNKEKKLCKDCFEKKNKSNKKRLSIRKNKK